VNLLIKFLWFITIAAASKLYKAGLIESGQIVGPCLYGKFLLQGDISQNRVWVGTHNLKHAQQALLLHNFMPASLFSENVCFVLSFVRRFLVTEFFMLVNLLSLTRYIFIFRLKNPAAFQDDFWHLFVNLWMLISNTLIQCATMPFQYKELPFYLVCCGKSDKVNQIQNVPYFFEAQLISALLHAYIYLRIKVFKQKARVSDLSSYQSTKSLFLSDLNKDVLMDTAESFSYLLFFGTIAGLHVLIVKYSNSEEIARIGNSLLITPPLIILALAGTLYWRNKPMRRWVKREICNFISNQTERLGFELQPIAAT